jgi:hypothetical protein
VKDLHKTRIALTILIISGCLMREPKLVVGMVQTSSSQSDDKCPDGSRRDPQLGCRQTTKQTGTDSNAGSSAGTTGSNAGSSKGGSKHKGSSHHKSSKKSSKSSSSTNTTPN